ncbi:MAG: diadenylate cyclase CdaA [Clostridia bacterium]|nr:diadenylate cyclase CdaA [Clostridia bacterium]
MFNISYIHSSIGEFFSKIGESAQKCFSGFSFIDAIDILLLSVILFFLFRFIRGRKAGVLLIGIAVVLLITTVAYAFNLDATHYVFSQLFKVGVIAIVIIFQPEIRDALERVGSGSISGLMSFGDQKKKHQMYYSVIDNVSAAIGELSRSKTGALIVISRTTTLDEVTQTGVKIDSEVSSFLLRNLFYDKAPLHDGAVIIDDTRIAAAGCVLPNTRRTDIDGDLGTRHRAAIGMSEISDAIIIIVSEETGIISVAYECTLTRNYTVDTLRKFLVQKLIKPGQNKADN